MLALIGQITLHKTFEPIRHLNKMNATNQSVENHSILLTQFFFLFLMQEGNPLVRSNIPWNESFNARSECCYSIAVIILILAEQHVVFCS